MEKVKVAVLGGSGYTALELMKILLRHPHAEIVAVTSREPQGVAEYHPSLTGRIDLICEPFDADALKGKGVAFAFGCLPHGASMEAVGPLIERGIRVIDLSADYRLRDADVYAEWYREKHHDTANLAHAVYGIPELAADAIRTARLVANPGCYPQTAILGLAPLLARRLVEPTGIIVDAKSGVSGAGRSPKLTTHFPECNESVSAYSVGKHRHQPEMEQVLAGVAGRPVEILFTPHLIPMDRGILATIYATPTQAVTESELLAEYRAYYEGRPFVRVRDSLPATKDTAGTNFLDLTVRVVRGKVLVVVCEDNLVRGASGVAVQNFNLMAGFDERLGLW